MPDQAQLGLGLKLPQIITDTPAMEEARSGIIGSQKDLAEKLPGLQANVEARRASLGQELEKPVPQAPKLQDLPSFQPRQLTNQDLTMAAGIFMAMAGLGTKAMRGDTAMAFNAAASAMKGFNEGNLEQAKLDMEQFNTKMKGVIAQNRKMSDEYRNIIESRKLSLEQKSQLLQATAASRDDQVMLSTLKSNNFKTLFDLESSRVKAVNQATTQLTNITMHAQQMWQAHKDRMAALDVARARAGLGGGADGGVSHALSPKATNYLAAYVQLNGRMPVGFSRQNPMAIQTMNRVAETAEKAGLSPEQWAAAGPIVKTQLASLQKFEQMKNAVESFGNTLKDNIGQLRELSAKVARTNSAWANKSILWLQENVSGDPDVAEYLLQYHIIQREAARVITQPGLTGQLQEGEIKDIEAINNGALSPEQVERNSERLEKDLGIRLKNMGLQEQKIIRNIQHPLEAGKDTVAPTAPYADPEKEKRYQEWKRSHP